MAVANKILPAQQHLQAGVLDLAAYVAKTLPGVLVEVAYTGIKGGAAPHFEREEADFIHLLYDGEHVTRPHPGGDK